MNRSPPKLECPLLVSRFFLSRGNCYVSPLSTSFRDKSPYPGAHAILAPSPPRPGAIPSLGGLAYSHGQNLDLSRNADSDQGKEPLGDGATTERLARRNCTWQTDTCSCSTTPPLSRKRCPRPQSQPARRSGRAARGPRAGAWRRCAWYAAPEGTLRAGGDRPRIDRPGAPTPSARTRATSGRSR